MEGRDERRGYAMKGRDGGIVLCETKRGIKELFSPKETLSRREIRRRDEGKGRRVEE